MPEEKDSLGFTVVGSTPSSEPEQSSAPAQKDPLGFDIVGGGSSSPTPSTPSQAPESEPTPSAPAVDPLGFTVVGGSSSAPSAGVKEVEDASAPWYKKIWNFANKPIIDIDDALGRTGQAGGFEKGVNDLVSGLTSPLSLALTIGTLGAGGLAESAGASVLKTAGVEGAEAIANITKGAKILQAAETAGKGYEAGLEAAQAAGVNTDQLIKGLDALRTAGLGRDSLLTNGLIRRGGGAALRQVGVGAASADKVAAGAQALVNAGFTIQNVASAIENSPKVLDALKEGDYETAKRLAIDSIGTGALGVLGAGEFARESGALRGAAQEKLGLRVKPTDENLTVRKILGERDAAVAESGNTNSSWVSDLRKQYKDLDPADLHRTMNYIEAGNEPDTMAQRFNAIAEAAGRPDRRPVLNDDPNAEITSGMKPERVRELIDRKSLANKDPKYIDQLLDSYDPQKLSDRSSELANTIREKHLDTIEDPRNKDVIPEAVSDYVTHRWKEEEDPNAVVNTVKDQVSSGNFPTTASSALARTFDTSFEGQLLGRELKVNDPIALAADNANTFARVAANRSFLDSLQDKGVRASDGRPLAVLSGGAHTLGDEEHRSIMVNPDGVKSTSIPQEQVQTMLDNGEMVRAINQGIIKDSTRKITPENIQDHIDALEKRRTNGAISYDEQGNVAARSQIDTLKDIRDGKLPMSKLDDYNANMPHSYQWTGKGYKSIDMTSLKDWKHVATTPTGDNVFLKSDLMVHPEAAEYLKRILGADDKGVGSGNIGKAMQFANKEGKGLLLFGSPFHVLQEGLRGILTGINPFGIEKFDLANDPQLRNGVENGLTLGKDRRALSDFQDGMESGNSKIISQVPGLKQVQHGIDHFLFDKYIPGLKARGYRRLVDSYTKAYPDWSPAKVAQVAAADTNERFGGLAYKSMGRAAATQNFARLVSLAPDWLESEVRAIARPFGSEGKVARADMLKATAGLWATARVLNLLISQKPHLEAPFGVAMTGDDGKEKIYSMRSLPTDMLHAVSDPYGFVKGRFSPLAKIGSEVVSGRDSQGKKMQGGGIAMDLLSQLSPIPVQSAIKAAAGQAPDTSTPDQIIKAGGFTVQPYKSEAAKMASRIASDHSEQGPVDPASLQRHQLLQHFEDQMRVGKITPSDISQLVISGQLPPADAKKMMTNFQKTQSLSPELASLYTRASRLPTKDLLDVYDAGTAEEKRAIAPLVQKSGANYLKHTMQSLTPRERLQDPTVKRVMSMMPSASPY